ncbi:hypothetical protein DDE18_09465 [Nocardioides gansuensis]|uniref:Clp R domain-containing protein n=2 Tax=Nocardioides gansuensis TaxID=2138300 RepID=A0A2T8FCQ2_9ACTN|nr:hypothetical protein DDE18_09465 [Nocardioides gansuensis]
MRLSRLPPPVPESEMTPAARAVLGFAKAEAQRLNHHYLGTEHLLLGIMRDAASDVARILASHADLGSVRTKVSEIVGVGSDASAGELPLTPRASKVLHFARREAEMYGERRIAPAHLLLGILREGEGIATHVLLELHIDMGTVRAETSRSLGPPRVRPADKPPEG